MFLKSRVTIGGRIRSGSYYFAGHITTTDKTIYYTVLDDGGVPVCLPGKYFEQTVGVN